MLFQKMRNLIKSFFKTSIRNANLFSFGQEKLILADIGSSGGLDIRWSVVNKYLKIYSFDPDLRASITESDNNIIFSKALWSENKKLKLNLTKFPDASSVYEINDKILKDFLNYECHKVIETRDIEADNLKQILKEYTFPDFIKIDTEGADLEILKGAGELHDKQLIGIQIEVQFVERNIGSPFFSDIDNFCRSNSFQLMSLAKQSWIRNNNLWNIQSNPQLIWADAVYIINKDRIFKLLNSLDKKDVSIFISKFICICIVYGFYDYALSIIYSIKEESRLNNEILPTQEIKRYEKLIRSNVLSNSYIIFLNGLRLLFSFFTLLLIFIFWSKRDIFINYFKNSLRLFTFSFYALFSRFGPYNASVNDGVN